MKRKEHRNINDIECKHCYKCGCWLPLCSFGSDKSKWDGLNASCKECEKKKRLNDDYKKRVAASAHASYERHKHEEEFKLRRMKNKEIFYANHPNYNQDYHKINKEADNARNRRNYWVNKEAYNARTRRNNSRIYRDTHPHAGEKVQSQGEEFVADWLQAHGIYERFDSHGRHYHAAYGNPVLSDIYYIRQYWFDDLKDKKTLFFDFYIPRYEIIIEINGIKHYAAKSFAKDATKEERLKEFAETTLHDRRKRRYAKSHGITVFDIKYGFENYNFAHIENELNKIMQNYLETKNGEERCE